MNEVEEFEKYILTERGPAYLARKDGEYENPYVQEAWEAWEARSQWMFRSLSEKGVGPQLEVYPNISVSLRLNAKVEFTAQDWSIKAEDCEFGGVENIDGVARAINGAIETYMNAQCPRKTVEGGGHMVINRYLSGESQKMATAALANVLDKIYGKISK